MSTFASSSSSFGASAAAAPAALAPPAGAAPPAIQDLRERETYQQRRRRACSDLQQRARQVSSHDSLTSWNFFPFKASIIYLMFSSSPLTPASFRTLVTSAAAVRQFE